MNNMTPALVASRTTLPPEGALTGLGRPGAGAEIVLKAQGLTKRFHEGSLDVTVLQGVDLQVHRGETLAIVGTSGSGKSTLLHLLGGLDAPTSGSVELFGQNLAGLSAAQQGRLRNSHLGFVYQFHHLLPEFSALDNVAMPLTIRRVAPADAAQAAMKMLASVGLENRCTTARRNCPAVSASAWPLPVRWSPAPIASWPMSRQAIWTAAQPTACLT
jgi:lipoprotein-releasing system ATP-binding protein